MEMDKQSPPFPTGALQAVIFDLDGTLADTAPDLAHAVDQMMVDLGYSPCGLDNVRQWIGHGVARLIERALTHRHGRPPTPAQCDDATRLFVTHYARANGEAAQLYPGTLQGLRMLNESGIALGCVTNKPRQFTLPLLERLDLLPWFGAVTSGDDLPHRKPHPLPLLDTARRLGASAEAALMVGDSDTDVSAARAAGIRVALVSYGYNGGRDPHTLGAEAVVDSIAEIPALVAGASVDPVS